MGQRSLLSYNATLLTHYDYYAVTVTLHSTGVVVAVDRKLNSEAQIPDGTEEGGPTVYRTPPLCYALCSV